MTPPSDADLLARHVPVMRYDSQETFFADSAREMTDCPDNLLRRGTADHAVLAKPPPGGALSLEFLGTATYGDGHTPVHAGDQLSDTKRDYRDQGRRLHMNPEYRNRCYGRAKRDPGGALWLQYWFFYFYNDYNLAGGLGLHEGDWEMIQLRVGADGATPDSAVYAQHNAAEARPWAHVEKSGGHPVVYPGRGSHASYFESGLHFNGVWFDAADGGRPAPPLTLELLTDDGPPWAVWPGQWGDTEPGIAEIESASPRGPGAHAQWGDPAALTAKARAHELIAPAAPPDIRLTRTDGGLRVAYDFTKLDPSAAAPERLVVTVNSPDEPDPPATDTFVVDAAMRGEVITRRRLDDAKRYDVHASVVDADGRPSATVATMLDRRSTPR